MIYTQEQYDALLAVCRSYKQDVELLTAQRNKYAETLTQFQMECIKEVIAQKKEAEKRFEYNMKEALENEKKQSVKGFADFLISQMGNREYMGVKYKQGVFSDNDVYEMINDFLGEEE